MMFRPTVLPIDPAGTPDRGYATMRVTSPYGYRDDPKFAGFHGGLDIGNARLGDDVIAVDDGIVLLASNLPSAPWNYPAPLDKQAVWGPSYGGNVVVIDHGEGVYSQYAHLRDILVSRGQTVRIGRLIGHVGDTGSAAPPPAGGGGHLHFGIRLTSAIHNGHNGWVDPWPRIQPTGDLQEETMTEIKPGLISGIPTPCVVSLPKGAPISSSPDKAGSALPYDFKANAIGVTLDEEYGAYLLNSGGARFFPLSAVVGANRLITVNDAVTALRRGFE